MKYQHIVVPVLVIACSFLIFRLVTTGKGNKQTMNTSNQSDTQTPSDQPPKMTVDTSKSYTALLHTDKGDITIVLNVKDTPVTVNNFVHLTQKGFYDDTFFHRVIKGFMIQGGDPKGNGTGGPGYTFEDEAFNGEYDRGTVAMANSGPDTNGSQFFIMHADYDLPKNYVIFGKVTAGMDVVDAIATSPVEESLSGEASTPEVPVTIDSAEIRVK